MENIMCKARNEGDRAAAVTLLTIIPCRKNGWFTDFVAALKTENYKHILELFGPKFLAASGLYFFYTRFLEDPNLN